MIMKLKNQKLGPKGVVEPEKKRRDINEQRMWIGTHLVPSFTAQYTLG
jgi:hypothetical protein